MKCTKDQKKWLKTVIKEMGDNLKIINDGRVTIAAQRTSANRGKIAWAIHSDNDGKFHRKYGEYVALDRLCSGVCLPVEFDSLDWESDCYRDIMRNFIWEICALQ